MQRSAKDAVASINISILERKWLLEKIIAKEEVIRSNDKEHKRTFLIALSNELSKCDGKILSDDPYKYPIFYKSYQEHVRDFLIPIEALFEHLTPDEIQSCMGCMHA